MTAIRAGKGPTSNFRSYFLSTVKTVAIDLTRAELRLVPTQPEDLEDAAAAVPPYNPALRVDQDLVRVAFGRLSEREQHLLWRTAVEGTPSTVLAPMMGLSATAVRVAALRARDVTARALPGCARRPSCAASQQRRMPLGALAHRPVCAR